MGRGENFTWGDLAFYGLEKSLETMKGLLLKLYRVSGQIFGLISSFSINKQLQVVLDGKSSQEYPVNSGVP